MKPKTAKKFKNSRFGKNNPILKRDKLGRFKKYV